MKTLLAIVMTVVLTAALLTGCGCTNRNMETTPEPTVLPTNEEIWNTTETTRAPTYSTTPTEDTVGSRARRMIPDMR